MEDKKYYKFRIKDKKSADKKLDWTYSTEIEDKTIAVDEFEQAINNFDCHTVELVEYTEHVCRKYIK